MARPMFFFACSFALLLSMASAKIVEHTFHIGNLTVERLCRNQLITAVNGTLPGPIINVREGDTLIIHAVNKSPYNISLHWHGIFQKLSAWADGPSYITQCPIPPGGSYTYKFTITGQEGTLWWHAHITWLRATVYGALIIRPRAGRSYPFPKPHKEYPIMLGEWWNGNVVDIENEGIARGGAPNGSNAYTINGQPGDLYPCSQNNTYKLQVEQGKTYLLRIINAALNIELFFKIANHNLTVVAVDASYTEPYYTDVLAIAPGQTIDALLTANQPIGNYYMASHVYHSSSPRVPFGNTTTTAIIQYLNAKPSSVPKMPVLPPFEDTPTAHKFYTNLTSLKSGPFRVPVPLHVDEKMFMTFGLGLLPCEKPNKTCAGPSGFRTGASINNVSFENPIKLSMLEAFFYGVSGIYTRNFPDNPPVKFNYTSNAIVNDFSLAMTEKGRRAKKLRYNSTVEIVLQNTALLAVENHPMHLHAFNFHVLAQGFGNFDRKRDEKKFNYDNPQERNTIAVPVGGWAVIRFRANNPGIWMFHCHLDVHMPWGLQMPFEVENGPTPESTLPPPPLDLPRC